MKPPNKSTREYFSRIGRKGGAIGGKSRSPAKLAALAAITRARVERQRAARAAEAGKQEFPANAAG